MANATLASMYGFATGSSFSANFSLVSFENILFDIIAYVILVHEQIFDNHKAEIDSALYNQKSGRPTWYRTKALNFQYGFDLLTDSDEFDNGGALDEAIENSKIIKYAAVNESESESRLIIKIAGENNGELAPIDEEQKSSFEAYLNEIKYAGVNTSVINYPPDLLYLNLKIYRDPLVLDSNGMSIQNGNLPVEDAIQEYMKELPFNGEFIIAHFVDKLQQVEGVLIPHVSGIQSSWITDEGGGYGTPQYISVKKIPESGYFKVESFENISYVV